MRQGDVIPRGHADGGARGTGGAIGAHRTARIKEDAERLPVSGGRRGGLIAHVRVTFGT